MAREGAIADVVVLLETCERRLISARNAEGAVGEDALGIVKVAKDFFHAPLTGRITEIAIGLGASGEQQQHLAALVF